MLLLCAEVLAPRALWAIFPKATMLSSLELPNSRNLRFGAFSVWLLAMRAGSSAIRIYTVLPQGYNLISPYCSAYLVLYGSH